MSNQILNNSVRAYLIDHPWIIILLIFIIILKAIVLWHSARRGQKIWFIAILILNTLGLLEITYLIIYRKQIFI
jgi:hypothetical protein